MRLPELAPKGRGLAEELEPAIRAAADARPRAHRTWGRSGTFRQIGGFVLRGCCAVLRRVAPCCAALRGVDLPRTSCPTGAGTVGVSGERAGAPALLVLPCALRNAGGACTTGGTVGSFCRTRHRCRTAHFWAHRWVRSAHLLPDKPRAQRGTSGAPDRAARVARSNPGLRFAAHPACRKWLSRSRDTMGDAPGSRGTLVARKPSPHGGAGRAWLVFYHGGPGVKRNPPPGRPWASTFMRGGACGHAANSVRRRRRPCRLGCRLRPSLACRRTGSGRGLRRQLRRG